MVEVINTNKKIIVLVATFFALTMLIIPVMAVSPKKVPAIAISIPAGPTGDPIKMWTTNGDVLQIREREANYIMPLLKIGDDVYTGTSSNIYNAQGNLKTGELKIHYDAIWTINEKDGGFKGKIQTSLTGWNPGPPVVYENAIIHCVLHGFGEFEGWKLMLTADYSVDFAWTGYCLKA